MTSAHPADHRMPWRIILRRWWPCWRQTRHRLNNARVGRVLLRLEEGAAVTSNRPFEPRPVRLPDRRLPVRGRANRPLVGSHRTARPLPHQNTRVPDERRQVKTLMTVSIALLLAAPLAAAPRPDRPPTPLAKRIDQARARTFKCQHTLGLDRSPVSNRPIYGQRYARWVLTLWEARVDAYCGVARQLYGTRGSQTLRSIAGACLSEIIDRETAGTWNPQVYNYAGSGAYGLPQALPGHKMASAGADWRTNPLTQLKWMRGYTRGRYGSECGALSFHNANGWY